MFFVLSKTLLFLLSPSFWIITLLVWSFITRHARRKKWMRITAAVMFVIFSNPLLLNVCVRAWQPERTRLPVGQSYSAAILMGGMTSTDKHHELYFGPDADRFIQATKLYRMGIVKNILLTGGTPGLFNDKRIPEAFLLRNELLQQGVPDSNIIVEHRAWNSFENAMFSKKMLDSLHLPPPYLLVTSAIHVPRAVAAFKKAGVDVIPVPAAYHEVNNNIGINSFIPSTEVLTGWNPFIKEIVGKLVYRITGKA